MPAFPRSRTVGLACAVMAPLLAVTACGATGTSATGPAGASQTASSAGADSRPSSAVVTDYLGYVGGKAGAADAGLAPITLGWVNVEGGPAGNPEATLGAHAAVKYVNDKLGGIGGHPLELNVCTVASAEEEGQKCGQQLLGDKNVSAIAVGNLFLGDASFNSVVAGAKPVLVGVATGPSMSTAKNTYSTFGDLPHIFGTWGTYARDVLKAKSAAVIHTNTPGDKIASGAAVKGLEAAGLTVKSVGFEAQAVDLIGPVTAAGAMTADVVVPISLGAGCVGIAKALKQLNVSKPVVSTPLCLSPDVAQGLGGDLPGWTYGIAQTLPMDSSAADSQAFLTASAQAGLDNATQTKVFAPLGWSTILTYAKVLNTVGADKINPASVAEELKKFTGPVIMGAAEVQCGKYQDAQAVCNDQSRFYQYGGKGAFKPLTDWIRPVQ
ncbi:ABC transporter substrate-binding protein [Lentzea nigeriaca]|uniref:ABC transporter substrate-binding protein n=1 Tax=Lentzea nigeriaca TaxID=1128665 RepID=UPI00195B093F|nr:ABC transporter substrate-binding protein [Lentzea nigeriaca]MBM7857251.1 branched-chain amino acid transport system substrate-binding protein [Lentzea nigeriaca]